MMYLLKEKNKFPEAAVRSNWLLAAVMGSRAAGANRPESDWDLRGVMLPTLEQATGAVPMDEFFVLQSGNIIQWDFESGAIQTDDVRFEAAGRFARQCWLGDSNSLELLFRYAGWIDGDDTRPDVPIEINPRFKGVWPRLADVIRRGLTAKPIIEKYGGYLRGMGWEVGRFLEHDMHYVNGKGEPRNVEVFYRESAHVVRVTEQFCSLARSKFGIMTVKLPEDKAKLYRLVRGHHLRYDEVAQVVIECLGRFNATVAECGARGGFGYPTLQYPMEMDWTELIKEVAELVWEGVAQA